MHLILKRGFSNSKVTLGMLQVPGLNTPIYTLEEPWKDNQRNISCIPPGVYRCTPHNGRKFKGVWRLEGVPNRTAILIHAGNTTRDIEGCILVGLSHGNLRPRGVIERLRAVLSSRKALNMLKSHIGSENSFTLTII